ETRVARNAVCLAGEVRSEAALTAAEIEKGVRDTIHAIGYVVPDGRFAADTVEIENRLHEQAAEIARAVDRGDPRAQGAGDQGMMFGYATAETPELMPAPIVWAHALTRGLAEARRAGEVDWLRPDSKSQVSVKYVDGVPMEITRIVVSTQHAPPVTQPAIREYVIDQLIPAALPAQYLTRGWEDLVLVNPSG